MRKLNNFTRLSGLEKKLFFKSFFLMLFIRFSFYFFSFKSIYQFLKNRKLRNNKVQEKSGEYKIILESIQKAGRYIPGCTCLIKALAAQYLLREQGYDSQLQIGVLKDQQQSLKAHAWLEMDGKVVIGENGGLSHYATFSSIEEKLK